MLTVLLDSSEKGSTLTETLFSTVHPTITKTTTTTTATKTTSKPTTFYLSSETSTSGRPPGKTDLQIQNFQKKNLPENFFKPFQNLCHDYKKKQI